MVSKYKKSLEPIIAIIASPFLSWNPSILTILGLVSSIFFFLGLMSHIYWLSVISILGFIFDMLDGYVARTAGKETPFGAFLDSTTDRISDFFFIVAFGFGQLVSWELVVFALFTSFFISYLQARGEAVFQNNKVPAKGVMQRTERIFFLLFSLFLFLLFPHAAVGHLSLMSIAFSILIILNSITIVQRYLSFRK